MQAAVRAETGISVLPGLQVGRMCPAVGTGPERRAAPSANVAEVRHATEWECRGCATTGRTCPSCVQRRRRAWSLVRERGESLETAARMMRLSPAQVRELVAQEADRQELRSLRCDSIPVQLTRSAVEDALARDPDLTIGEIAHWLDMRQADFERAFLGRPRDARPKERVNVANASRLMIALGRAPNELPGC